MLLEPFSIAPLGRLKNRVAMTAMTRGFADAGHRATSVFADYYGRRAEDGVAFILSEGVVIDQSADGYNNVPHIRTPGQAASWKPVIQRVHAAGSRIFCQLWHCGRISHPDYTGGIAPVSSTNRRAEGVNRQNGQPFGVPRALTADEMPGIYDLYVTAARNALAAGFDGVEAHLGHGYLADQFFDARVNDRTDHYGGSAENRCRFGLELTDALIRAVGADKVMVRISPSRFMDGLYDWPDLEAMLRHLIPAFHETGLSMLDVSCARADYFQTSGRVIRMIRKHWPGLLMGGASLSRDQAEDELRQGFVDLVTWGRALIANPDLVARMGRGDPLAAFDTAMLKTLE
jgi:N-ethylmaleimide reductase